LAYKFTGNAAAPTDATATIFNQANVGPTFSGFSFSVQTGAPLPGTALTVHQNHNLRISGGGALVFAYGSVMSDAGTSVGGGTITGVTGGVGLTGSGTAGGVTLAINPAVVPQLGAPSNTFTGSIILPTKGLMAGASQLVLSGGHVGVGITSPTSLLHVQNVASTLSSSTLSTDGLAGECNSQGCNGTDGITSAVNGNGVYDQASGSSGWAVQAVTDVGNALVAFMSGTCTSTTSACNILTGINGSSGNVIRIDNPGKGFFNGGTQTGGADFVGSVETVGPREDYAPGDVHVIGRSSRGRLSLSSESYSTRVTGIYSTRPGVLAAPHGMDDPRLAANVPLAIVGIVPCKVTAENGSIAPGDLLVTSSTLGHAMKGTNRRRTLRAVVGKALEPLRDGKGIIQVLVTLQ
jgi:hypothetical protein